MAKERRLVIVANRLPVQRARGSGKWEPSPGGLVTALLPVVNRSRGAWVGWAGSSERTVHQFHHERVAIHPITLSDAEMRDYYHGFSNRTLWPLFHDAIRTPEFHRHWWRSYAEVNRRFARAAARAAKPGDAVWVQDFHLLLVPAMLRAMRPDVKIGFFLHIPFPPEELFAWLPWRRQMLEGLLGADLVGFQIQSDAQNFSRLARAYAGADGTDTELTVPVSNRASSSRTVHVGAFPISIDFDAFEKLAHNPTTIKRAREIRRQVGNRKIILSVDRLDYTKGIDTRMHVYAAMLEQGDVSVRKHVLIQVAVPSREAVPEYATLRDNIELTVGRINGEYSQPGMVAVHYFRRSLPRDELVAYYVAADIMLVAPLRDGMNLVCKEFVAARPDRSGVLVLSEFAGAARELRRALLVNPRDIDGMAAALRTALTLGRTDARQRMGILRMMVRRHDVHIWAREYLDALEDTRG